MLTRDTITTDEELMRYMERVTGNAYQRVGAGRTHRDDIARILREHGAEAAPVHLAVREYIGRQLPAPVYDAEALRDAQKELDYLASCGYSASELHRARPGSRRGGQWDAVRAAERACAEAMRGLDAHAGALDAAIAAWWAGHASTIEALCYRHADMLLAARRSQER